MKKINKFYFFTPLMHKQEYELIEKYLNKDDILLEWGTGNSTLYFSGLIKKVISIEHDKDYYDIFKTNIDIYKMDNIDLYHISKTQTDGNRYEQFKDYVNFPIENKFKFNKVLIDGRARKYCADILYDYIDNDVLVFVHDFNYNNVEGYDDPDYFNDILSKYDIIERVTTGQGIVVLKKKI